MARFTLPVAGVLLGMSMIAVAGESNDTIHVDIDSGARVPFSVEWRVTNQDGQETLTTFQGESPQTFTFVGAQLNMRLRKASSSDRLSVMVRKGGNVNRHTLGEQAGSLNITIR